MCYVLIRFEFHLNVTDVTYFMDYIWTEMFIRHSCVHICLFGKFCFCDRYFFRLTVFTYRSVTYDLSSQFFVA